MNRLAVASVGALVFACLAAGQVQAQYPITTYYAPTPVVTGYYPHAQAYYGATTSYYRPAAVAPTTVYYPGTAAAYVAPRTYAYYPTTSYYPATTAVAAPVVTYYTPAVSYYRPVASYYSPYGGPEVRVPGQPVRNTLRAIVP